ncbi:hypothetical protein PKOR_19045 [Pontibacter korlensis]|uniref:Uncharacterized protein n=1 Tax=Pontibacter korlensis TaxID=400092 RepID=A0A0E3UYW7_9BACT|nr:hypothetical protein [Pontibacter korlensis]AKD04811.1 hypothetical protein PKOR_19045 [Pontibacter korlensis]
MHVVGQESKAEAFTHFTDANVTFAASGLPSATSLKVLYRINATSGTSFSTETFTPPATPVAIAVPKDDHINYTFPDITVAGVLYRSTTVTAGSSTQTGPTNSYKLPNNGANTITGVYVASCIAPTIAAASQPANQITTYGNNVDPVFSVTPSGSVSGYQWQVLSTSMGATWSNIAGANSSSYTVTAPTVDMNGYQYRVVVSGCSTSVFSSAATLTVNPKGITAALANR